MRAREVPAAVFDVAEKGRALLLREPAHTVVLQQLGKTDDGI
jgi:hypothetical protein